MWVYFETFYSKVSFCTAVLVYIYWRIEVWIFELLSLEEMSSTIDFVIDDWYIKLETIQAHIKNDNFKVQTITNVHDFKLGLNRL